MKIICPVPGEEKFFRRILNRAPQEVARIMANEFGRRFQPDCGLNYVLEHLQPCQNFVELDLRLRNFTRLRRPEPISDNQRRFWPPEALEAAEKLRAAREAEHDFWDAMRFLLHPLSGAESAAQNKQSLKNHGFLRIPKAAEEIETILADEAFKRLTSFQKGKLRDLLASPAAEEFDFFRRLWGSTPSQAARLMAAEFVERFAAAHGPGFLTADEVYKRLRPRRRWAELYFHIIRYVQEKCWADVDEAEVVFWDDMRILLQALPRHKYTVKPDSRPLQPGKLTPGLAAHKELVEQAKLSPADLDIFENWSFGTCELCWRWVPTSKQPENRPAKILCPEHQWLSPEASEYRKARRLSAEAQSLALTLERELRTVYPAAVRGQETLILTQDLFFMTDPASPLEQVREYLENQESGARDLEVLLRALNAPDWDDLDRSARRTLTWRIREHLKYPTLAVMKQLALAEAWLRLMNRDRRYKRHLT